MLMIEGLIEIGNADCGIVTGFHRDPTNYPKMSPFMVEIRRRLWATILEMALQSSLDSGMPPLISSDDYDTLAPKNIDDSEIIEDSEIGPKAKPNTIFTQTSIQIILLRSLLKRLAIGRLLNHFRSKPSYEDVLRLSSEVSDLLRDATVSLQNFQSRNTRWAISDLILCPIHFLCVLQ